MVVGQNWVMKMFKYTFNVSFQKTIVASSKEKAYDILQDKTQQISEYKFVELINKKEC